MIPELGHFALILALPLSLVQVFMPAPAVKSRAAHLIFFLSAAAFLSLIYAFTVSDFSLLNVMQNSHTSKPLIYKISGAWGNHEGSMLLWMLMLSLFSFLCARRAMPEGFKNKVLAVQGLLAFGFLAFILLTSNPFTRLPPFLVPSEGFGLNPVLQHPALAIHPPLLYMGYVGFSAVFAFAIAGLLENKIDSAWAVLARPYVLLAWSALSAGVALGAWWAYEELGWGGWWFWDPVENASLMPWLLGTALVHSILVLKKRGSLPRWCALLAIMTFSLSLLGTFLVRSGILTSVHAFATDPLRGVVILVLLSLYTGGALAVYAIKAHKLESTGGFAPLSRESALILGNLFFASACATVFIGTLYPVLFENVSVGPPYFAATFIPLIAPAVLLAGLGHIIAWKKADIKPLLKSLKIPFLMTLAGLALIYAFMFGVTVTALACFALGLWLFLATLYDLAARAQLFKISYTDSWKRVKGMKLSFWGMFLAHAGMGIAIIGMTGSTLLMSEQTALMKPGERLSIASYELKLEEVGGLRGPNYEADAAILSLRDGTHLMPERRYYPAEEQFTTEAAIKTYAGGDVYVALGEKREEAWVVRAYTHPLIACLWLGFAAVILGGVFASLSAGRKT